MPGKASATSPRRPVTAAISVTAVAGSGEGNNGGVERGGGFLDGDALIARLSSPIGIAKGLDGSLLIIDRDNHRVRKLHRNIDHQWTTLITIAGGPASGLEDSAVGTMARFLDPTSCALDTRRTGRLLLADCANRVIRSVDTGGGAVTTIAGTGEPGRTDGGLEVASFRQPYGIACSSADGTIFVSDDHRIREISPTGDVSTLAGSFQGFADGKGACSAFNRPLGIAVSPDGLALFVADCENHCVRRVDRAGNVMTVAGDGAPGFEQGLARTAKFYEPTAVAVDSDGVIYVADYRNARVRRIEPAERKGSYCDDAVVSVVATVWGPLGLYLDEQCGQLYVTTAAHRVLAIPVPSLSARRAARVYPVLRTWALVQRGRAVQNDSKMGDLQHQKSLPVVVRLLSCPVEHVLGRVLNYAFE